MVIQDSISAELKARMALERQHFQNAHSLGQNFILDIALVQRLVDVAEIKEADNVLEIGPGAGVMTDALSEIARRVLAVEVDNHLEPVLESVLKGRDNVQVLFKDFMKLDLLAAIEEAFDSEPYRVVANLPYYITSDILLRLINAARKPDCIHIMVQKEAAERMMSAPGTKSWCAMAAMVQYFGVPEVLLELPPEAFDPPPHVTSCFMRIKKHVHPVVSPDDEALFLKLINAAFAMRRKTLSNNLKAAFGLSQEEAKRILTQAGQDERVRGEALTLQQLCCVANVLGSLEDS